MTIKYIRDTYGVPAEQGMTIKYQGRSLVIVDEQNGKLKVWCEIARRHYLIHPTYEVEYPKRAKNG